MKTLLTSTALAAMLATGAAANTLSSTGDVYWSGNTNSGGIDTVQCTFTENTDGKMTYDESTGEWTTAQADAASVKVLVRNGYADSTSNTGTSPFDYKYALDYIKVEPVKKDGTTKAGSVYKVDGTEEYDAAVFYNTGGTIQDTPSGWTGVTADRVPAGSPDGRSDTLIVEDTSTGNPDVTQSGYVTLNISGKAKIIWNNTSDVLDANAEYKVRHLVTCMQNGTSVN